MGVFKSMRDLQKQAKDMERNMPPVGDRMRQAQDRMMAAQTQAANWAVQAQAGLANGTAVKRTVIISSIRQVGMINFDLLVEFELTVMADGLPPYPATAQQAVSQMQIGRLQVGTSLQAVVDPSNPTALWLDLSSAG
jgi:phage shock protein A